MAQEAINKKILAKLYGVSAVTLRKWLKPFENKIGEYRGKAFTPAQIKIIYEAIGEPN